MKLTLAALLLAVACAAPAFAAIGGVPGPDGTIPPTPYFDTIVRDPKHPKVSASILYTSKADFDGGETSIALVYHKGDPTDTLWPQKLLDLGMPPLSWSLLELGFGGNRDSAFIRPGFAVDVAPTLLGPLKDALHAVGGVAGRFGSLLVAEDGTGVKLSVGWKTNLIQNGGIQRFDDLRLPPRYGIGYTKVF